jgi:hypothetical protein
VNWGSRRGGKARAADEPGTIVAAELRRSRRYARNFAVVRLAETDPVGHHSENGSVSTRWLTAAASLGQRIRCTDRIGLSSDGAIYAILPEADRSAVEGLIARVMGELPGLRGQLRVSAAIFPQDGSTVAALLAAVMGAPAIDPEDPTLDLPDALSRRLQGESELERHE